MGGPGVSAVCVSLPGGRAIEAESRHGGALALGGTRSRRAVWRVVQAADSNAPLGTGQGTRGTPLAACATLSARTQGILRRITAAFRSHRQHQRLEQIGRGQTEL